MLFIWSFYSSKNPEKNVSCFQIKYWGAQLFLTKTELKMDFKLKMFFIVLHILKYYCFIMYFWLNK